MRPLTITGIQPGIGGSSEEVVFQPDLNNRALAETGGDRA